MCQEWLRHVKAYTITPVLPRALLAETTSISSPSPGFSVSSSSSSSEFSYWSSPSSLGQNDADFGVKSWGKYPNLKSAAESRPERREICLKKEKTNTSWTCFYWLIHFCPPPFLLSDNFHKCFSPFPVDSHTMLLIISGPFGRRDPNHLILIPFCMCLSESQWKMFVRFKRQILWEAQDSATAEKCPCAMSLFPRPSYRIFHIF